MDARRNADDEMVKADENLFLDIQMFVAHFRRKALPLMSSKRAEISLHELCNRLSSNDFFLKVMKKIEEMPEKRSAIEAILWAQDIRSLPTFDQGLFSSILVSAEVGS